MDELEVRDLIEQSCKGSRAAFDTLVEHYYDMMYKVAYHWSGSRHNAEDITHNAFLKMADGLSSFKFQSSFETWLYRLVMNAARDYMRKHAKEQNRQAQIDNHPIKVDQTAQDNLQLADLGKALQKLPEDEKQSVILVCAQGFTHQEAADISGCKESTISWRIHKARKKLNDILGGS